MNYDEKKEQQRYRNMVNNAQGHSFENYVHAGCVSYQMRGIAYVQKTPEPFRTLRKEPKGRALVQFTGNAEPDFKGCLYNGRIIVFETKYTGSDKIKQAALTEYQAQNLEIYSSFGGLSAVCVGVKERFYFVPYSIWKNMKEIYGRKYVDTMDLEPFRVKFNGAVLFLDYVYFEEQQLAALNLPPEVSIGVEDVLQAAHKAAKWRKKGK